MIQGNSIKAGLLLAERHLGPRVVQEVQELRKRLKGAGEEEEVAIKGRLAEIVAGIPLQGEDLALVINFLLSGPC